MGVLPASQFVTGSSANDSNDRFIYNPSNGDLWFDRDGIGNSFSQIKVASLDSNLNITNQDFQII